MSFQCWIRRINFTWHKHFLRKTNCATPQTLYNKMYKNWKHKIKVRGHPELNQGPLDLQSNALPLSYIPVGHRAFFPIYQIKTFSLPYGNFPTKIQRGKIDRGTPKHTLITRFLNFSNSFSSKIEILRNFLKNCWRENVFAVGTLRGPFRRWDSFFVLRMGK